MVPAGTPMISLCRFLSLENDLNLLRKIGPSAFQARWARLQGAGQGFSSTGQLGKWCEHTQSSGAALPDTGKQGCVVLAYTAGRGTDSEMHTGACSFLCGPLSWPGHQPHCPTRCLHPSLHEHLRPWEWACCHIPCHLLVQAPLNPSGRSSIP